MAELSTYPVTFPYGATSAPYSPSNPHRGDDRACPIGTQITVNGTKIALTGSTGFSSGPHSHIGKFVNGVAMNPFKGGFSLINPVVVFDTGENSKDGKFVRLRAGDGSLWVYLHNSVIQCKQGDKIGGPTMTDALTKEEIILTYAQQFDVPESQVNMTVVQAFIGKPLSQYLNFIKNDPSYKAHFVKVNLPDELTTLAPGKYRVN